MVKYIPTYAKGTLIKKSATDLSNNAYAMFYIFPDFPHKSIFCGYSFELHRQVDAIQIGTHRICLYKEIDKKVYCM